MKTALAMSTLLLFFGVIILVTMLRPNDDGLKIEQQKTLQFQAQARGEEAQSKSIEAVADRIPGMWPVVFLSSVALFALVVVFLLFAVVHLRTHENYQNKGRYFSVPDNNNYRLTADEVLLLKKLSGKINRQLDVKYREVMNEE